MATVIKIINSEYVCGQYYCGLLLPKWHKHQYRQLLLLQASSLALSSLNLQ